VLQSATVALTTLVCVIVGALVAAGVFELLYRRAERLSRAHEEWELFYVGTGMAKYYRFDQSLRRFRKEHPNAFRIVRRSLLNEARGAAASAKREAQAYTDGLRRLMSTEPHRLGLTVR
jgi:hypothetical protein